ncbi:MAG: hypothetical protein RIR12_444 [Bacteroidota bacterium]|jgi:hypothetical protein
MKYVNGKALLVALAALATIFISSCGNKCDFGPENWTHFVPKDTARQWVRNYLAKYDSDTSNRNSTNLIERRYCSNLFSLGRADDFKQGKWMMGTMMCQDSVIGFRIYYGLKTPQSNTIIPILVGVASGTNNDVYWKKPIKTNDIKASFKGATTEEVVMDISQKIPPPMSIGNVNLF